MLAVFDQGGDVSGVDLVGLAFADALLGLLSGLDGIEHRHLVGVVDQEVAQAVPVVPGRFHADEDLSVAAGIFEARDDALVTVGVVVEGL